MLGAQDRRMETQSGQAAEDQKAWPTGAKPVPLRLGLPERHPVAWPAGCMRFHPAAGVVFMASQQNHLGGRPHPRHTEHNNQDFPEACTTQGHRRYPQQYLHSGLREGSRKLGYDDLRVFPIFLRCFLFYKQPASIYPTNRFFYREVRFFNCFCR